LAYSGGASISSVLIEGFLESGAEGFTQEIYIDNINAPAVPEPSCVSLMFAGCIALFVSFAFTNNVKVLRSS